MTASTPSRPSTPPMTVWRLFNRRTIIHTLALFICIPILPAHGQTPGTETIESVPDDAVRAAFEDLKLGSGTFAPAREAAEDWSGARIRIQNNPAWEKWLSARQAEVDNWMSQPRDQADWVAGWLHDYVDPKTGAFLTWTPSTPMPADTPENKRLRGGWIAHTRTANIERTLEAARLYKVTGETRYRDWVATQLDLYASAYLGLPLQTWNGKARLLTQSLDEAVYGMLLLDAARLIRNEYPISHVLTWDDKLFVPMADNLRASYSGDHNIAVWQAAALTLIGIDTGQSALADAGLHGEHGIGRLLATGVSADYFWHEMTLFYQDYVVDALARLFTGLSVRGRLGNARRELWIAQNLMLSPTAIRFPNGAGPTINDSPPRRAAAFRPRWAAARRVFPTGFGVVDALAKPGWNELIDPPEAATASQLSPVVSHPVPGLDGALLRNDDWQAFVRYGQKLPYHAQQESMTYELQYRGIWILRDAGTVGYGSPLHLNYFRRAAAHNVPLIDGDGQSPWPSAGRVDAFDARQPKVTVSHRAYRRNVDVRRNLEIRGRNFIDDLHIRATAAQPKNVGAVFNTDCSVRPLDGLQPASDLSLPAGGGFTYWSDWTGHNASGKWTLQLECGGQVFTLRIASAHPVRVFIGNVPDSQAPFKRRGIYIESSVAETSLRMTFAAP